MPVSTVIGDSLQVRKAKIGAWDGDGTYSNVLELYGVTTIEADLRLVNAIREGDGKRLAAYTAINGGTLRITAATNQLSRIAALLGQTYAISGSTPNQVGKLQIFNQSIGYIGFICGIDDDTGRENAFHLFIPKAKITSDTFRIVSASGGESPEFGTFEIELEAFADAEFNVGAQNEVQTLTITGTPTGGTFTLSFGSETTSALDFDFTAAEIDTALEALENIGAADVACTGGPLPGTPVVITFGTNLANAKVPLITADDALLTGGTDPTVTIVRTTTGSEGNDLILTLYEDEAGTVPLLPPAI
jgi:hypothetical protein